MLVNGCETRICGCAVRRHPVDRVGRSWFLFIAETLLRVA